MYAQVEKPKENKRLRAGRWYTGNAPKQVGIVCNGKRESVAQRRLILNNKIYESVCDVALFATEYKNKPEAAKQIMHEINNHNRYDIMHIKMAIEHADLFAFTTSESEEGGTSYNPVFIEGERKYCGDGYYERMAGHSPSFAIKPYSGTEVLTMKDMMNCLAIAGYEGEKDNATAIAAGHFVTPDNVDTNTKTLTDKGKAFLDTISALLPNSGNIIIRYRKNSSNIGEVGAVSGKEAANLAKEYLGNKSTIGNVLWGGDVSFMINDKGKTQWSDL